MTRAFDGIEHGTGANNYAPVGLFCFFCYPLWIMFSSPCIIPGTEVVAWRPSAVMRSGLHALS